MGSVQEKQINLAQSQNANSKGPGYASRRLPVINALTGQDSVPVWRDSLEVVFETDPEIIKSALPPFLEPTTEPLARFEISVGTSNDGKPCGTAWFGVGAIHQGVLGEYALFTAAGTDTEVALAREFFGYPCKQAEIEAIIKENRVQHLVKRCGHTVVRLAGETAGSVEPKNFESTEYAFRLLPPLLPDPHPQGMAELLKIRQVVLERRAVKLTGTLRMGISPLDPVGVFRVRRVVSMRLSQRTVFLGVKSLGSVEVGTLTPFLHQRYDVMVPD